MQNRPLTVLVTGFGPFPGVRVNPTGGLATGIAASKRFARLGFEVAAHVFPTRWATVARELPLVLARINPDAVLHLGVAARRRFIAVELFARPSPSSIAPDAGGESAAQGRRGGALMRIAAPAAPLLAGWRNCGAAVRLSPSAGRYLCNAIYHQSLELRASEKAVRPIVFVHVPMPGVEHSSQPLKRLRTRKPSPLATRRGLENAVLVLAKAARRSALI